METLLQIITGLGGSNSLSAQLAEQYSQEWLARNRGGRILRRDLSAEPVPHLTAERYQAFATPQTQRTPRQQAIVEYSDSLIAELNAADVIVLAVPMHNF